MAVDASNVNAVLIDGVNAGVIADAWVNYPTRQSEITTSFNANIPSSALLKYPFLLAGYNAGVSVTVLALNQACQLWFGRSGFDAASYIYTPTNVSLKGVKRAIWMGDSLVEGWQGVLPTPYTGPNGGTSVPQGPDSTEVSAALHKANAKWAVIPRVNQGHGATAMIPYLTQAYSGGISQNSAYLNGNPGDIKTYRPIGSERVYLFMWPCSSDFLLNNATASSLLTAVTNYITTAHADGFYVVLLNVPNAGSYSSPQNTQRLAYNSGLSGCGADALIDTDAILTGNGSYINYAPHFNDAGYAAVAAAINTAIPNP